MLVLHRDQILALKAATSDERIRAACEDCLWNLDVKGELRGYHTASGDLVRDAVVACGMLRPPQAHVIYTERFGNGFTMREAQVWVSWEACVLARDPFSPIAERREIPLSDVASEILRWRAQNGAV